MKRKLAGHERAGDVWCCGCIVMLSEELLYGVFCMPVFVETSVCHFDFVYIFQGDERSLQKVLSFE